MKIFWKNFLCGALIGIAVIIPGLSGASIAVITRTYSDIIENISSLFKTFKKSFLFLLPVVLGVIVGLVVIFMPIKYALEYAPFPTVMLFAGLIAGSLPVQFRDGAKDGFRPLHLLSLLIPAAAIIGITFIPSIGTADLSVSMPAWGYIVLLLMGVLAAAAFVVPGISGSMILLIFGYYYPIIEVISSILSTPGHTLLVLVVLVIGALIGLFVISKIIRFFMKRFPRGTYWAITGFVLGSVPAIFVVFPSSFPDAVFNALQISLGVILCLAGLAAGFFLTLLADKKKDTLPMQDTNTPAAS